MADFHSAFVALIGRPNSGKSTLLNAVLGQDLAIVSDMPQTTRQNMRGILNGDGYQVVFLDTPGIHDGKYEFNKTMFTQGVSAFNDDGVDIICYLVDLSRRFGDEEDLIAKKASGAKDKLCIIFNKADQCEDTVGKIVEFYERYPALKGSRETMLSAIEDDAKELFMNMIKPLIPEGPKYYPDDDMTDSNMRFFAAEYIRKQIIYNTDEEVPHASFVEILEYREEKERHFIEAEIHVETQGQKGIVIGKGASVIKKIRKFSERNMKKLTGVPVRMSLFVKVTPNWRDNSRFLAEMGVDVEKKKGN